MQRYPRSGLLVLFLLAGCAGRDNAAPPLTAAPTPAATPTLAFIMLPTATPHPDALFPAAPLALTEAPAPPNVAAPPETQPLAYTVQPGDTLQKLALQFGVPVGAIQYANAMGQSTALQAGQSLTIPPTAAWAGASPYWTVYEVQAGDTMLAIAAKFGLDFIGLVAVNELTDADTLSIGQMLVLPLEAPLELVLAAVPIAAPPLATPTAAPIAAALPSATSEPTAAPTAPPGAAAPVESTPAEIGVWPAEVFGLINAERAAAGIGPLAWNDTLAQAAYLHGLDCQQRGECDHTGSDGSTVKIRVTRAGYPTVGAAECIVYAAAPAQAVSWWMDEVPPNDWHRRTILSTWVTEIGIAVVPNHLGTYYFIADFGRP